MKCVCGYEEIFTKDDEGDIVIENDPFIKSKLKLYTPSFDKFREECGVCEYDVFICPKCGTLKIEIE